MSGRSETRPVFRPLKRGFSVFGLTLPAMAKVGSCTALALLVALLLGIPTAPTTERIPETERARQAAQLEEMRDACAEAQQRADALGVQVSDIDLDEEDAELIRGAESAGIGPDTTNGEIDEMVPLERTADRPVFGPVRYLVLGGVGFLLSFGWNFNYARGASVSTEVRRAVDFLGSQRVYTSVPREFEMRCLAEREEV